MNINFTGNYKIKVYIVEELFHHGFDGRHPSYGNAKVFRSYEKATKYCYEMMFPYETDSNRIEGGALNEYTYFDIHTDHLQVGYRVKEQELIIYGADIEETE